MANLPPAPEPDPIQALQAELAALEGRARELSACLKAMTLVGSSLEIAEVLDRAITSAMDVMNAEAASIMLLDEATGELFFRQATGEAAAAVREIRIPRGHGIAGWVAQTGSPVVVEDAQNDPRFFRGADDRTGFVTRSILAVPLTVKDKIIGVAEAINKRGDCFRDTDLPLFSAYASLAAVAIENARLHRTLVQQELLTREIDIARQIQAGLQGPPQAHTRRFHFNAVSAPARSVGGDFYDWIPLGEGRILVVIADVSGKGIPAALLMSNALSRLRAEAGRLLEPAAILIQLNDALAAQAQRGLFVTLFLALLEPDGTVSYSSAGHPLPLLLTAAGFRELPPASGPPLAILPCCEYRQETVAPGEGDLLVLFTDGVSEAMNTTGDFFGYDRLQEVVAANRTAPEYLAGRIQAAVAAFEAGREQTDDLTVAVICRTDRPPELVLDYPHLEADDLGEIRRGLEQYLKELEVAEKTRTQLVLAIDEACTNIIRYAYQGRGGPVELRCRYESGALAFQLRDCGCGGPPELPAERPRELKPGGLGLHILQEVMDDLRFETAADGGCLLRMKKTLEPSGKNG